MTRCGYCRRLVWPWQDRMIGREDHVRCWREWWDGLLGDRAVFDAMVEAESLAFWSAVLDAPDRWSDALLDALEAKRAGRLTLGDLAPIRELRR